MQYKNSDRPRALIIGGSLGGLFAANILYRAGWDIEIFERVDGGLSARGAGIVTHPQLFSALEAAGVDVDSSIGAQVASRVVLDRSGAVIAETGLPQTLAAWGHLHLLLYQALPAGVYHSGQQVVSVRADGDGVQAIMADSSTTSGDLLVAADGIRSMVRQQFLPAAQPEYAGYVGWRGLVDEESLTAATRNAIVDKFAFCLPEKEQMLGYPVAGANNSVTPGQRRFNFVWYRPADSDTVLPDLLTDITGTRHEGGIPPHLIRPDVINGLCDAAQQLLAPAFREIVHKTPQPFFQPIFDLNSSKLVFDDRIVLVGDAAYVARPHCGMGVTKAAQDAIALASALENHQDIGAALAAYESISKPKGNAIVQHARDLGAYLQPALHSAAQRAAVARHNNPDAIMRETAITLSFA